MKTLTSMNSAERAYMARRLPRTYRSMLERTRARAAAGSAETRPGDRRRARLHAFDRRRHAAAVAKRISSIPGRARAMPMVIGYFETRCRKIRQLVTAQTGIEWTELTSRSRSREIGRVRQAAMYLLLKHTHLNLPQVGALFGGRDHTTVIHARDKVIASPGQFNDIIEPIEHQLGAH